MKIRSMGLHPFNADLRHLINAHSQHLAPFQDQRTIALCSKLFVLPLLHKAFEIHISNTVRPHSRGRLNNATQLVHCEEGFLHVGHRLHIRADRISMAEDRPDVRVRNTCRPQRLFRMPQMLLRELFIIIVMQISNRFPILRILSEMPCHRPHTGGYIGCVELQMLLCYHRVVESFRILECQLIHVRQYSFPISAMISGSEDVQNKSGRRSVITF